MSNKDQDTANPLVAFVLHLITGIVGPLTWQNAKMWIKLIVLVLVIRWLWFEPFFIPSGSMEPTIHGDPRFFRGDRVAVNKLAFGPRYPFTDHRFLHLGKPKRWDIVVFDNVEEGSAHKKLIKRVVGLPGERIHIQDGKIFVNGEPQKLPPSMPKVYYTQHLEPSEENIDAVIRSQGPIPRDVVKRELERRIAEQDPLKYGILPADEYSLVPPGHYLLMGDNSPNSLDGRYFGWVPEGNIVGRAFCIWWPITRWRDLTGFSHTWWGKGLLYGLPLLLLLYELFTAFVAFTWRAQKGFKDGVVQRGDRVVVARYAFGLNIPFTRIPMTRGRSPRKGEIVLVEPVDSKGIATGPYLARVVSAKGGRKKDGVTVEPETTDGDATQQHVAGDHLIGSVTAVWRPFRRMGRLPAGSSPRA